MAIATDKLVTVFGPESNGMLMSLREFDQAEFEEGYRYELVHGVLIVSPPPDERHQDPNDELGHLLRTYQESHPQGAALNRTFAECTVRTRRARRTADRVIWAGLGRKARKKETPTIVIEIVSAGRRNRLRDYEEKREEYMQIKVKEYWIIDCVERILTVYSFQNGRVKKRIIGEKQTYTTPLLPGFELPLARILACADYWESEE